jgi:restriction system protein
MRCGEVFITGDLNMARRSRQHSSYNSSNLHATIVMPTFLAILGSLTLVQPLLWQIVFIIGSLSVIFLINQWLIDLRILRLRRRQLLELSPSEFEQRVALLLEDLGWKNVVIRGGSGDRGVDITAERDGLRYLVQCKRYSKSVGPNYVRDLVGALHIQGADRAILVATSSFTPQSRLEARGQAVELWDDKILLQRLSDAERIHNAQQVQRNQDRMLLALGTFGLNLVLAGIALLFAGIPQITLNGQGTLVQSGGAPLRTANTASSSNLQSQGSSSAGIGVVKPTSQATPTPAPTSTPTPAPTPTPIRPTAIVFNGGNVRAEPSLKGAVLDQIHANETVVLLGRTADGVWLRIINPRQQEGWVHRSLLTIEPTVEATLPVIAP